MTETKNGDRVKEFKRRERRAEREKIRKAHEHAEQVRLAPYSDRKLRRETVWDTLFIVGCLLGVLLLGFVFFEITGAITSGSVHMVSVQVVLFALGAMAGVLMLLAYAGILTVRELSRERKRRNS